MEVEEEKNENDDTKNDKEEKLLDNEKSNNPIEVDKTETIDLDKEKDSKDDENVPRALHRTSSIFLRNLAPTITKAEVETVNIINY